MVPNILSSESSITAPLPAVSIASASGVHRVVTGTTGIHQAITSITGIHQAITSITGVHRAVAVAPGLSTPRITIPVIPVIPIAPRPHVGIVFSQRYLIAKRALDLVLSALLLVVALLVMIPLAIAIKLGSEGPIFFRQRRVGQDGAPFDMLKFRSMYTNSDDTLHRQAIARYMRGEPLNADGPEHAQFKLARDPRITPIGQFIRKTSLDELPQLFNVLKGEMSLVGPRPPIPYEVADYSKRANTRLLGKPGLTGPWQVYGRSRVTFETMVEMDIAYLQQQSIWEDLKLIALTLPAILFGWGAA